jgi:TetR/AcrR family transcriptional regulator, mexJK operon transcriptional repressor
MDALETFRPTRDERRAAILEIGRAAFLQDGYAATSMSQIAARVGGSKATLYNYFPSKKDLFIAVADAECTQRLSVLFDLNVIGGDMKSALTGFCRRFLTDLVSHDMVALYRLIIAESERFPEIGQAFFDMGLKRGLERLAEHFMRFMATGEMRRADPDIAAVQLLDMCAGHLHRKMLWGIFVDTSPNEIDAQVGTVVSTFLAAYGSDELSRAARQYTGP